MPLIVTSDGVILNSPLAPREAEVLSFLANGYTSKEIGIQLRISPDTVKKHLKNCYRKLGVHNRVDAIRKAGLF